MNDWHALEDGKIQEIVVITVPHPQPHLRMFCEGKSNGKDKYANQTASGRHISYQRAKRNTNPGTSLLQLEGVGSTEAARFYLGKKVAFVYRASKEIRGSKIRLVLTIHNA
jgi:ribosomal protein L35AE/L33A